MAICKLNQSLLRSQNCGYTLQDITKMYVMNFEDVVSAATAECDATAHTGVQVTGVVFVTGDVKVYEVIPAKNTGAFSDTLQSNDSGAKWRNHSVTFNFNGEYSCAMPDVVDAFSLGKYIVVVQTAAGTNIMLGRLGGLEASNEGDVQYGGEAGEGNAAGLQVTLSGNQAEAMLPVTEAGMTDILAKL